MAKKVDRKLINRRLGGGDDFVSPVSSDDEGGLTPRFLVGVVAAMLAVGGAAFYFVSPNANVREFLMSSRNDLVETSSADGACKKLWVKAANNGPALDCYLTTDIRRFCNPDERSNLLFVIRKYREDRMAWDTGRFMGGIKTIAIMRESGVQSDVQAFARSIENPESDEANRTGADAHVNRLARLTEAASGGLSDDAWRLEKIPDKDLIARLRSLAKRGYVSSSDFGWVVDPLAKAALKDLGDVQPSPCGA